MLLYPSTHVSRKSTPEKAHRVERIAPCAGPHAHIGPNDELALAPYVLCYRLHH